MGAILPLLLLPVLMYFLLIRPQQKKMREQQALLADLGAGDEVMTTAGIYGYINAIEGDMVWLEIAENVEIRVVKAAISRKITAPDASAMPPADEETDGGTAPTA
jgi:preprotein translocase subunit YajC